MRQNQKRLFLLSKQPLFSFLMKAPLSFALIGCGKIGSRHAAHINRVSNLIAVCDTDVDRAKATAQQYGCPYYLSVEELLLHHQPDVVSVCTPNALHAMHAVAALQAGCHVVCEKPMAIRSSDCRQMIEAAEHANRILFIVKQNRFNDAVVQVKNLLSKNKLGKIYSFQINGFWNRNDEYYQDSWHGTKALDGGTLFTQFSHFIDILYWLLGDVASVQSYLTNAAHQSVMETEDTGVVILTMQSGAIGTLNYTVNSFGQNMEGSITLFGEKGTVKIGGQYLNTIAYQNIRTVVLNEAKQSPANDYGSYKGSMNNHDKVYQNVIDVLCHGAAVSTNAYEGLKTVEIIEKIYAANEMK